MGDDRSARPDGRFLFGALLLVAWAGAATLIVFGYESTLYDAYARLGWYGPYVEPPPSTPYGAIYGVERVREVNHTVEVWGNVVLLAPAVWALALAMPHLRARTLFIGAVLVSVAAETAQLLSRGRTAQLSDVVLNAVGAGVAAGSVALWRRVRRVRRSGAGRLDDGDAAPAEEHGDAQAAGDDGQDRVHDDEADRVVAEGDERQADRPVRH